MEDNGNEGEGADQDGTFREQLENYDCYDEKIWH